MNAIVNAIEVKEVCKAYPGFQLDHVSLSLPSGTILGLVGENGAGKTTLIKLILGMLRKDAGTIRVLESADVRADVKVREDIGVVMDEVYLPPAMKAPETGKMLGMVYWNWDRDVFEDLLSRLRIPTDKQLSDFSRGNKMKLGIACALSHHPRLLVLDEATSGLDPVVRDELLDILLEFTREEDHSILMSSHIVSDLEKACDYIAFLHEGKFLLAEEKDKLFEQYGKLSCSREDFAGLNPAAVIGTRETAYGVECIVRKEMVSQNFRLQPVHIEEVFVMMARREV